MNKISYASMTTPVGSLTIVERDGLVVASGFVATDELLPRITDVNGAEVKRVRSLGSITDALEAYFNGDVFALDSIPVEQPGTPFRTRVWRELRKVKPGRTVSYTSMKTPVGSLTIVERDGLVVASGFVAADDLLSRITDVNGAEVKRVRSLGSTTDALEAYFNGEVFALDSIPVEQPGTPFRTRVWRELRKIKPGRTVSYTTLARRAGNPAAVRAAGTSCGTNRVAPIVPCHRAVRSDGSLGGYYYGLEMKEWLLDHERKNVGDS